MMNLRLAIVSISLTLPLATRLAQETSLEISSEHLQFFEKNIRPVLIESCYKCHSAESDKVKGGLLLDSRQGAILGGETGAPGVTPGQVIVRVDPRYFRPTEVETLLGDPTKAREKLGWTPQITTHEMCREMVSEDLKAARRHALLKTHGYDLPLYQES